MLHCRNYISVSCNEDQSLDDFGSSKHGDIEAQTHVHAFLLNIWHKIFVSKGPSVIAMILSGFGELPTPPMQLTFANGK